MWIGLFDCFCLRDGTDLCFFSLFLSQAILFPGLVLQVTYSFSNQNNMLLLLQVGLTISISIIHNMVLEVYISSMGIKKTSCTA